MNSDVKSFLLGLSGVFSAYLLEWASSTDFGVWTPVIAAGVPVLVNAVRLRLKKRFPDEPEPPVKPDDARPFFTGALLLAVLCVPACAEAQFANGQPRAIIQGPNHAIPGEMIVLDAAQSEGATNFRWQISPELKGRKQLIVSDDGKRCQVASYGGRYVVTLAVANPEGIDLLTWELTVDGKAPCPPPEPKPTPPEPTPGPDNDRPIPQPDPSPVPEPVTPKPVAPPLGKFGIAPDVFRIASESQSATRVADCTKLAGECQRIADAEWANLNAMAAEIVAVLKALPVGWEGLKSRVQTAIAALYSAGLVKNREDLAALLLELKPAFEQAAKVK